MRNALFVAAAVLVVLGVVFVFWPVSLIVAGFALGAAAYLSDE